MATSPPVDPIEFLVTQKFPPLVLAVLPSPGRINQSVSAPSSPVKRQLRQTEMDLYRKTLGALPADELEALFKSEWDKAVAQEFVGNAEKEEAKRFFHHPGASADFDHWSKAAYWSLEEAAALSFGKAPEVVNSASLQPFQRASPFPKRYARLLDLARRASIRRTLYDPCQPILFVKWAEQNDIEFPAALAEKVISRSGSYIDWKQEYEKLEPLLGEWQKMCAELGKTIDACHAEIESLTAELLQLRAEAAAASVAPPPEKPQSTRERIGMLKVIYAMAIRGYGIDPAAKRSKLVPEIAGDLAREGLSLSDDTIRRYIKEACDLLPEWREDCR